MTRDSRGFAVNAAREPDWLAINLGFSAKQRRAFNAFHMRLFNLIDDLEWDVRTSDMAPRTKEAARKLRAEIGSIPFMGR